jgi:hypothetical protein
MSDGQFSSKPLRSDRLRTFASSAGEFSTEAHLSTDVAQDFLQTPAVSREIDELRDPRHPEVAHFRVSPLHKRTPEAARELGRPLASATLVQEYLIGLIFLRVAGWIFMVFGLLFMLFSCAVLIAMLPGGPGPQDPPAAIAVIGAIGLLIGAIGAWFGIFRGRVINEMCWFCPRGMIWMTEGVFDWYAWEDVPQVFCDTHAVRPAIGISLGRNVSWVSYSNTTESRAMVDYIEKRASAACLDKILPMLAEGKSIRFGRWRLSRFSMHTEDVELAWRDMVEAERTENDFVVRTRDQRSVVVPLEDVPFPSLFAALARACLAYTRVRAT